MRINDFMNNIEIVKDNILQSEKEYLKLLKVVGSNQRYDFLTQLSIYDKVPNAKACARYDYWKKQYNRVASKGEKGIPYLLDKDKKSIDHIFDISQTTPIVKNINKIRSIDYWQFDFSSDINILKNTISENNFEPSEVLNENIFLLSRLYGDEDIDVALNDLRITADKKLSFQKFMRDSISYATASRFNILYPIDVDNVKQNLQNLTPISLEYIGNIISTTSHNIIEDIREKSVELKRTKGLTNVNDILYNSTKVERRDIGGIENELRGESERIRGDGDKESVRSVRGHRGDSLQDERDSGGRATSGRGIPKESWSELGDNEAGLFVTGTHGRELDEASRTILGQDLDRPLERDASESRELHQDGKAENDESLEDRERGKSSISNDDVSIERDTNQGDNRSLEENQDLEKEANRASFFVDPNLKNFQITNEVLVDKLTPSERLEKLKQNLEGYEASLENAKEELTKPFEKADELKNKTLRLAEINKLLDLGDVDEIENNSPLLEDLKRTIIDYANYEFSEDNPYEAFDKLYPNLEHISLAFTHTPDDKHTIQYEINADNKSWTQYVDDMPIRTESFLEDGISEQEAINNMIDVIKVSSFDDLVSIDSEDLRNALGLEIDDDGNFYDPLAKDLDNDGVPDRYDNDFKDSDYFESTYDVEDNLHNRDDKEDKPSVLSQIKEFKEEESKSISRDNTEKEFER